MNKFKSASCLLLLVASGCASTTPSSDNANYPQLEAATAQVFGVDVASVQVSNVSQNRLMGGYVKSSTYYDAHVSGTKYRCVVHGTLFELIKVDPSCTQQGGPGQPANAPAVITLAPPAAPAVQEARQPAIAQAQVREAQQLLNALGHDAGPPDGLLGPRTASAIASFQRTSGIAATGALDAQTLDALKRAAPAAGQVQAEPASAPSAPATVSQPMVNSNVQSKTAVASATDNVAIRMSYTVAETELKEAADPFSKTITIIAKDRKLKVLRDDGQWLHVQYDGHDGYVFSEFVGR